MKDTPCVAMCDESLNNSMYLVYYGIARYLQSLLQSSVVKDTAFEAMLDESLNKSMQIECRSKAEQLPNMSLRA